MLSKTRLRKMGESVEFALLALRDKRFNRVGKVFDRESRSIYQMLPGCAPEDFTIAIDGGANHGQFSKSLLKINPHLTVIAVEPLAQLQQQSGHPLHSSNSRQSLLSLQQTYPSVRIVPKALSNVIGTTTFFTTQFDECSSLLRPTEGQTAFDVVSEAMIETTTLDTIIEETKLPHVDLLKLDLQGGEMLALQGAVKSLKTVHHILIDLNIRRVYDNAPTMNDVTEFLHDHGFKFAAIVHLIPTQDGSIAQCDGLFINMSKGM
jgi:FkbM family methyltransferase